MGIYVNPGNIEFQRAVHDYIYVDKSELITHTNNRLGRSSRYLCVSRPRRFGKSMAADMLTAYYSKGCDSGLLFKGLKIEQDAFYHVHQNAHNVIRIDVQRFLIAGNDAATLLNDISGAVVRELLREFPSCADLTSSMRLQSVLDEIYAQLGETFIFIIDEWDSVFRMAKDQPEIQKHYLDFLRNLFKGAPYVELAYMTGILPIKKYGEHSAVNMFDEYSMTNSAELSSYYGFTEEEVRSQCDRYGMDFDVFRKWYDGYLLNDLHIYNPKSVVDALRFKRVQSYWTGTETYEALKVYIECNFDGLREKLVEMLGGGRCRINTRHFQNDMITLRSAEDVLTLLVHLGYLTYDCTSEEVFIPNREIEQEFVNAVDGAGWAGLMTSLDRSMALLESTWNMDGTAVAAALDEIHSETVSLIRYSDENSLSCVLYIAYYSAAAWYARPLKEMPSGKGYADLVYLPLRQADHPALVVELKWNVSADTAISQIKSRRYTQWLESYVGDILLVGINYDKKTKRHTCIIERHLKDA